MSHATSAAAHGAPSTPSPPCYDRPDLPLFTFTNAYGDVQIGGRLPTDASAFEAALAPIVSSASRGVWLRVPFDAEHVSLLPAAHALGFTLAHHVRDGVLTLQAWRGGPHNPTPAHAHTDIGAGAFVVNRDGHILLIRERFDESGRCHIPGGHVDAGEDIASAGVREACEETGVRGATALGIVCWRQLLLPIPPPVGVVLDGPACEKQLQNTRFGSCNLAAFVLCYTRDDALAPDDAEISFAGWVPPDEALRTLHDHEAILLRAMVDAGQIAAATALARAPPDGTNTNFDTRDSNSSNNGDDGPCSAQHHGDADIPGLSTQWSVRSRHARWDTSFPTYWSTALPAKLFADAARSVSSTQAVRRC